MTKVRERPPRLDITSWLLGGDLVQKPIRARAIVAPQPPGPHLPAKAAKILQGSQKPDAKSKSPKGSPTSKNVKEPQPDLIVGMMQLFDETSDDEVNFTKAQEKTVMGMKAAGKTWAEIAAVVKTGSKADIAQHYSKIIAGKASSDGKVSTNSDAKLKHQEREKTPEENSAATVIAKQESPKPKQKQTASSHRHVELTPATSSVPGKLVADDLWSKDDCATLERLEMRYRTEKWLTMQAGFYNMTGRMVSADLVKLKFDA